ITIKPPVRACRMLSIPSRSAVPGAIISSAFINPGSARTSESKSSPVRSATALQFRVFSISLAAPGPAPAGAQMPLAAGANATAMLGGLLQAALGVADPAQLAGEPQLAETGSRGAIERHPPARAGHRQRHGQIAPRLVHAHASDHVHEHVRAARGHAAVTMQD